MYAQEPAAATDVARILAHADRALDQQRYDEAAERYRAALRFAAPLPEAEYGLGVVLHAEGLRAAAERKYLLALDQQEYLRTREFVYEIRYRLATLYQEQNEIASYERQLIAITTDNPEYGRESLRISTRRVLNTRGLNRLFEIYRFDAPFAFSAHAQLGEHYVRSGNYVQAVDHMIFAFILHAEQLLTVSSQHLLRARDLSYSELLAAAQRIAPIRNIIADRHHDPYRVLFYLGAALYGANPQSARAREVWQLAAGIPSPSPWIDRARQRLASPQLEPLYR